MFDDHKLGALISSGPALMGVVNVTPDSFSDGGKFLNYNKAIEHGLELVQEGAHMLDIGGESSRPGAQAIEVEEEIDRVLPVIEGLAGTVAHISVDTRNAQTMKAALKAGANIINDISALSHDPESLSVVSSSGAALIAMHMQGTPSMMQLNPTYSDVVTDIIEYFKGVLYQYATHRIEKNRIIFDPGIGFGKTLAHNLQILGNVDKFHSLGVPVLVGASRKSFIANIDENVSVEERLPGSLSAALWCVSRGVQFLRVHDVKETRQAIRVFQAISESGS